MPHNIGLHACFEVFKVLLVLVEQVGIADLPIFGVLDSIRMLADPIAQLLGDSDSVGLSKREVLWVDRGSWICLTIKLFMVCKCLVKVWLQVR